MAGFTNAYSKTVLDAQLSNTDKIAWSTNGTSETAILAKTDISAWSAATTADPSEKSNTNALQTAVASGSGTVTHFAIFDSAGTTQKTDWTALTTGRAIQSGDKLDIAAGAIKVTLT